MCGFSDTKPIIRLIASKETWMDGDAVQQLHKTAELPGMRMVVGLPDLHVGKGGPIGSAFISEGVFYPHLAGNDIGCGMGLWVTDLRRNKIKLDRWVKKLSGLESPWEGDVAALLTKSGIAPTEFDKTLGTIGGGNHFAELQIVENVQDMRAFDHLGLNENHLVLLVHSGSRGMGDALLRTHIADHGIQGLPEHSAEAIGYIAKHDHAMKWAASNRSLIAPRFLESLGAKSTCVLDACHNTITQTVMGDHTYWLHRKGAVPSNAGPVVIPGSRGSLSYLVSPLGNQKDNAYSVAHGAGRKWNRSDSRKRLSSRYKPESLMRTPLGGRVICEDRDLLYQEAPQVYKDIDIVVKNLIDVGLLRVIAALRPLITYKTRSHP